MALPTDDLTTDHLDAGTDSPAQARSELYAAVLKLKTLLGVLATEIVAVVTTHNSVTNAHAATFSATANRMILRDTNGRAKIADPSADDDIATKGSSNTAIAALAIGVNQAWQDVSASRSIGTEYTNDTGRPIMVSAGGDAVNGSNSLYCGSVTASIRIALGSALSFDGTTGTNFVTGIIPAGHKYKVTGSAKTFWVELR